MFRHFFRKYYISANIKNFVKPLIVIILIVLVFAHGNKLNVQLPENLTESFNGTKVRVPVRVEDVSKYSDVVSEGRQSASSEHPHGFKITRARPSMEELALAVPNINTSKPLSPNMVPSCVNASEDFKIISDSIQRALNFYETHIDAFTAFDSAAGLQVLEGIVKHSHHGVGQYSSAELLQRIAPLVKRIFELSIEANSNLEYKRVIKVFENSHGLWNRTFEHWKPLSDLNSTAVNFSTIGKDKDTFLSDNNALCQSKLLLNCEVPDVCRRTLLEAGPQSQYMLTHQALYLLFAEYKSCVNTHPDIFGGWETNLKAYCTKMLLEAEFIAEHNFPFWGRDLLSEQIGICGFAGYPNLLRQDWIHQIISWQSASSNGCFLNVPPKNTTLVILDGSIPRRLTEAEKLNGTTPSETEICLPHLTSASLAALSVKWGWLLDTCSI